MPTLKQHTKRLLDLLPNGELMRDKYSSDTNQYKFWAAVASFYLKLENDFATLIRELSPATCETLIDRWEKEFGIPDEIFDVADTLEDRIKNVLIKKRGFNAYNLTDFQSLIDDMGFDLTLELPTELRYPPYDVPFYPLSEPGAYFLIIVKGDFTTVNMTYFTNFLETLLPINAGLLLIDTGA